MEWAGVKGRLLLNIRVSEQTSYAVMAAGGRRRLHLVGGEMMFWDTVGMSHHRVILVEASHAIHFIVDAAGDVLNVLHVGPTNKNTHTVASQKCPSISNHHSFYIFYSTTLKFRVQSVDR